MKKSATSLLPPFRNNSNSIGNLLKVTQQPTHLNKYFPLSFRPARGSNSTNFHDEYEFFRSKNNLPASYRFLVTVNTVSTNQQSNDISNSTSYFKLQNNLLEVLFDEISDSVFIEKRLRSKFSAFCKYCAT